MLSYLPQQLSEEKICEIVRQAVSEVGHNSIKHIDKVMAATMPGIKGRVDGKLVSQIVKQYLNK